MPMLTNLSNLPMRSKLTLGIADGWLKADGETIYRAKDLRVGLFSAAPAAAGG